MPAANLDDGYEVPWDGYDLDGTLAEHGKWKGIYHIGRPIKPMVDHLKANLARGKRCKIFTARVAVPEPIRAEVERVVKAWCKQHVGQELEVTNVKDMAMLKLYDDRAVQVERNTGRIIGPDEVSVPKPAKEHWKGFEDLVEKK